MRRLIATALVTTDAQPLINLGLAQRDSECGPIGSTDAQFCLAAVYRVCLGERHLLAERLERRIGSVVQVHFPLQSLARHTALDHPIRKLINGDHGPCNSRRKMHSSAA